MEFKKDKFINYINEHKKISTGLIIIILSPLLGTLLFYAYSIIVGFMLCSDIAIAVFWFSCILAIALLGVMIVLIDCINAICKK
jgi:hypothetical protein